jgi:hypothetical protein
MSDVVVPAGTQIFSGGELVATTSLDITAADRTRYIPTTHFILADGTHPLPGTVIHPAIHAFLRDQFNKKSDS